MFSYFQDDSGNGLELNDFVRFSSEFGQIVCENVPTGQDVSFIITPPKQPAVVIDEQADNEKLRIAIERAEYTGNPVFADTLLLLPFFIGERCVVAQLQGLDELVVRRVGSDWLEGLCALLLREFLLVKRACVDSLTGLLSSLHLEEYLQRDKPHQQSVLLLVSLYPKGANVFLAKKYQHKTVSLLKRFIDSRFPLFYLGQSCFAILCENRDAGFVSDFVPGLITYLKRDRCYRVHIGSTAIEQQGGDYAAGEVMRKAWAALHVASKRGPFAFCSYESIENASRHPFAAPDSKLSRWLLQKVRGREAFALLQINSADREVVDATLECVGPSAVFMTDKENVYLLLPDRDSVYAVSTAWEIQQLLVKKGDGQVVTIGVSSFPFQDFHKSETLLNCRKALRHAGFLEPGSIVVFDAVSLNISGDVYYGEGDLVRAVREYKRGLVLDPSNGNLLNSLGVCYAQMNRRSDAVACFKQACSSEDDQFMALYNLGMEQQFRRERSEAIRSLEQALALPLQEESERGAREDIRFQLAVLCIEEGLYEKALQLLLSWREFLRDSPEGKKAARYLGEAYYGLGKQKEAMTWLQRAMRYDEFDAEVLGLLGEIYLQENEGDDIALRFCEKSVELSPDSLELKLRLAKAQVQCGDFQSAVKSLQPCLRNMKTRPQALLQRGLLALEQKRPAAAGKWFAKILVCPQSDTILTAQARSFIEKCKKTGK